MMIVIKKTNLITAVTLFWDPYSVFRRYHVRFLSKRLVTLPGIFHGLPQSFQTNVGIMPLIMP
jgi:hypothetical protein